MSLIRARAFSFVLFVSKMEQDVWLPLIKADLSSYPTRFKKLLVSGAEICPTTERRHIHVYVEFDSQKHSGQLDRFLHLTGFSKPFIKSACRGDYDRIRNDYVKTDTKEDQSILLLIEWPVQVKREREEDEDEDDMRPVKKAKLSNQELRALVESGNIEAIKNWNYNFYLRNKGSIEAEAAKYRPKTLDVVKEHLWIVGTPGTGKSAITQYLWPEAYQKDLCNQNFEEYNNQEIVVLDDMDNKRLRQMTVGKLKNLCNPAGSQCKVNYGTVFVKARIVVTSNYSIKECFKHKGKKTFIPNPDHIQEEEPIEQDPDYVAICRRFREVTIEQFLIENNLRLMSKEQIAELSPEDRGTYKIFEEYDAYTEANLDPEGDFESTTDEPPSAFAEGFNKPPTKCTNKDCGLAGIWSVFTKTHIHFKNQ